MAKNQQTDPLDVLDRLKHFIEQIEQQDKSKASAFKSALMILSAPDSITLSSRQDIHLSAAQQISQTAGGSINLSTQNNLIAQASDKISLFAAQKGISATAAKGKIQLQAQDDALELIARKVIQIISTEDNIALTSAKEIILTAGGSQIKINGSGVFITTAGKFESRAAQHVFSGGAVVNAQLPEMPKSGLFSRRFDLSQIFNTDIIKELKYTIINHNKKIQAEYQFDQPSSVRVYSDSADNIELSLIPGVYQKPVDDNFNEHEAELLDEAVSKLKCNT